MLKPIFDEDVDFFSKKIILCAKGGDFNSLSATGDIGRQPPFFRPGYGRQRSTQ